MVQFIQGGPSRSQMLAESLGGGIQQGLAANLNQMLALKQEEQKFASKLNLLKKIAPGAFAEAPSQPSTEMGLPEAERIVQSTKFPESRLGNISDDQIAAATLIDPQFGRMLQEGRKFEQKKSLESEKLELQKLESEEKAAAPYLEEYRRIKSALPDLSTSINVAEDAVRSGDLSGFGKDYWAEKLDFPQLVSAKGKQLSAATKNFMAQGKELFGARPTNYDVSILEKMFAKIGESKWAQLSAIEMQKARRDLQAAKVDITDQIRRKYGRIPRNIDLLVEDQLKDREKEIQNQLRSKLEIYASLDGQSVDFRNTKKTLKENEYLVLKNGKPLGITSQEELKGLKGQGYKFIK